MSRVRSRVGRSKELLLSLEVERERWQRQSQAFGAQTVSLAGNAAVSSTFLAYMGMFDQEIRETLREGLLNFLEKVRVPVMADMVLAGIKCNTFEITSAFPFRHQYFNHFLLFCRVSIKARRSSLLESTWSARR